MPGESASRSSTTFPAPKKRGYRDFLKFFSEATSPEPTGWRSGSAMMHRIPARFASAMFFASVLRPGTTTAAAPASATSFPTCGIFSSCRLRMISARTECCPDQFRVLRISGKRPVDPVKFGKDPPDIRGCCIEPEPEIHDICTRRKRTARPCPRILSCRWASMISARTFIRDPPPIFTPRIRKSASGIPFKICHPAHCVFCFFCRKELIGRDRSREGDAQEGQGGSGRDRRHGGARGTPGHRSRAPPPQRMQCTSRRR